MGKLCENGLLKEYLDENCSKFPSNLCNYKDHLPEHGWDFVWESDGAFQNSGGWDHSDSLYGKIITDILFKPKYTTKFIWTSFGETLKQLPLNGAGDGMSKLDTNQTLSQELKNHHPFDYKQFIEHSEQQKEGLDFGKYNSFYYFFQYLLLVITILFLFIFKNYFHLKLFLFTLFFHVCNASFTGTFVNVINRLNTRSMWILELVCVLIIIRSMIQFYSKKINASVA